MSLTQAGIENYLKCNWSQPDSYEQVLAEVAALVKQRDDLDAKVKELSEKLIQAHEQLGAKSEALIDARAVATELQGYIARVRETDQQRVDKVTHEVRSDVVRALSQAVS